MAKGEAGRLSREEDLVLARGRGDESCIVSCKDERAAIEAQAGRDGEGGLPFGHTNSSIANIYDFDLFPWLITYHLSLLTAHKRS